MKKWYPINSKGDYATYTHEIVDRIEPPIIEILSADIDIHCYFDGKIEMNLRNIVTNYTSSIFPVRILPKDMKNIIMNSEKGVIKGMFSFKKRGTKIGIYLIN